MQSLKRLLIKRLINKGVEIDIIPALIRDSINTINSNVDDQNLNELNKRLQFLGWYNFELDEYTYQLIIANLETNAINAHDCSAYFHDPLVPVL